MNGEEKAMKNNTRTEAKALRLIKDNIQWLCDEKGYQCLVVLSGIAVGKERLASFCGTGRDMMVELITAMVANSDIDTLMMMMASVINTPGFRDKIKEVRTIEHYGDN